MAEKNQRGAAFRTMQAVISSKTFRIYSIVVLAIVAAYFGTLRWMIDTWFSQHGTYGPVFAGISGYLIWQRRYELRRLTAEPRMYAGTGVLLIGCFLLHAGRLGGVYELQFLSFIISLLGLVLLLGGSRYLKILGLPIVCLVFTIPLFTGLRGNISAFLQTATALIAGNLIGLTGIPVFRSGVFLEFPNTTLQVASVCSGANHVVALEGLALLITNWYPMSWQRKGVLFLAAFLFALVINGIRVTILGIMAYYRPDQPVHGDYDNLGFSLVFYIGVVLLLLVGRLLAQRRPADAEDSEPREQVMPASTAQRSASFKPVALAVVMLAATAVSAYLFRVTPVFPKEPLSSLPSMIGAWAGREALLFSPPFDRFKAESELRRIYSDVQNHEIKLYVGYFPFQHGNENVLNYLGPLARGATTLTVSPGPERWEVKRTTGTVVPRRENIYYYYFMNGRMLTDVSAVRRAWLLSALANRRTNAAIVVVSSPGDGEEDEHRSLDFLKNVIPLISERLEV